MISIAYSKSFKRAFRRKIQGIQELENLLFKKQDLFFKEPFHPSLKTHKLSGKLKKLWSFSINYELRVVFIFVDDKQVIFENIGTHDEVY